MKQNVSPVLAAVAIAAVLAIVGFFIWQGTGASSKNAANIEKQIQAGVAGGPGAAMTGPPPGINPGGGGAPPISTGAPMVPTGGRR